MNNNHYNPYESDPATGSPTANGPQPLFSAWESQGAEQPFQPYGAPGAPSPSAAQPPQSPKKSVLLPILISVIAAVVLIGAVVATILVLRNRNETDKTTVAPVSTTVNDAADATTTIAASTAASPEKTTLTRVTDSAGVLTPSELDSLQSKCDALAQQQAFGVGIEIVDSLDTDLQYYADMQFLDRNCGIGENGDGCYLLLVLDSHSWYISTHGFGIIALTDAGISFIGDGMKPYYRADDYYGGINYFLDRADQFVIQAKHGQPFDVNNLPR